MCVCVYDGLMYGHETFTKKTQPVMQTLEQEEREEREESTRTQDDIPPAPPAPPVLSTSLRPGKWKRLLDGAATKTGVVTRRQFCQCIVFVTTIVAWIALFVSFVSLNVTVAAMSTSVVAKNQNQTVSSSNP